MAELSFSQVDALLKYEPETGKLFWKERPVEMFPSQRTCNIWNTRYAGVEAFTAQDKDGYKRGSIFNKAYLAHRVIWVICHRNWPSEDIDHINGDPSDNRICNLRDVPHSINQKNQKRSAKNTSGVTGVYWIRQRGNWRAMIRVGGRNITLGSFSTFSDAVAAREGAEAKLQYHANHGRHD